MYSDYVLNAFSNLLEKIETLSYRNDLLLLRVNYVRSKQEFSGGLISKENFDVSQSRILKSIIDICNEESIAIDNVFELENIPNPYSKTEEDDYVNDELLRIIEDHVELGLVLKKKHKSGRILIMFFLLLIFFLTILIISIGYIKGVLIIIGVLSFFSLLIEIISYSERFDVKAQKNYLRAQKMKEERGEFITKTGMYKYVNAPFLHLLTNIEKLK